MTEVLDVDQINISPRTENPLGQALSYYVPSPKQTVDGHTFHMYAGFYYYMITAGDNKRFLRAKAVNDLNVKGRYDWENVIGLERVLERVLQHNLQQSPLTMGILKQSQGEITWWEPHRGLRNAEKRWLRVVQNVVRRLRCQ